MSRKRSIHQFGEKLRALRTRHNLTLKELARQLGYSAHGYISELEAGKKLPTVEFVVGVARLFGVTTDQLLKDELEVNIDEEAGEPKQEMPIALVDRPPTPDEVEKLRLVLSTYQNGTGQYQGNLPGWRDFERAVALVLGGEAQGSKHVFDVLIPSPDKAIQYGVACKMRRELDRIAKDGRVTIELSNSAGKFWDYLRTKGIDQTNYREFPFEVGTMLVELIRQWHQEVSIESGGNIALSGSSYLVLSWNKAGWYQLHQFPLEFPDPQTLRWYCPTKRERGIEKLSRRIIGDDVAGTLFEWYGESGGQLKYYPLEEAAIWKSEPFRLEPLTDTAEHGLLNKAARYFPRLWKNVE